VTAYEDARARLLKLRAEITVDVPQGAIIPPITIDAVGQFLHDLDIVLQVPETPVVNVPPDTARYLASPAGAAVAKLVSEIREHLGDATAVEIAEVAGIHNAIDHLDRRLKALEDPPKPFRPSFIHDHDCPAGGHVPAIVRGFDGCTCKVGP
jgi:hypothetical protein